ncbi:M48 family metallopeptidase [Litorivivens sp.]|uniref:M48 family metallopeptidase n=1 Tax=Litorivivens sp. TaxID=2020868 RepID=UPI003562D48C
MKRPLILLSVALLVAACTTSPTGRRQLVIFSDAEMSNMGATAFDEMKQKAPVERAGAVNQYVSCVADAITRTLPEGDRTGWEVVVFDDKSANAFALPGKKIGVHTGLLDVAKNQDQLASVIGHEVGHVLAKHSAERMSMQFVSQSSQQIVGALIGEGAGQQAVMAALGLGSQYGVLMPYGRLQESESDNIGVQLMAQAGFNPQASIDLWRNMAAAANGQPPEFLSTHPSHDTRISDLQALMPEMQQIYKQARSAGFRPNCKR